MIALLRLEIDKNDQELSTTSNFFELYLFKKFPSLTRKIWSPFDLDDKILLFSKILTMDVTSQEGNATTPPQ